MLSSTRSINIADVKKALKSNLEAEKIFDWIYATKEYNEKALEAVFYKKRGLKNVLERVYQKQVIQTQYRPLCDQLEIYWKALEETRDFSWPVPVDFLGLMNDTLNAFEQSLGSHLQTGLIRQHRYGLEYNFFVEKINRKIEKPTELTNHQKVILKRMLSATLSFCKTSENDILWVAHTPSSPKMDEAVWGEIIWDVKRIDELRMSVSPGEVISVLIEQHPFILYAQVEEVLKDLFGKTSHLGHLVNDYEEARRKEESFSSSSDPFVPSETVNRTYAAAAAMPPKSENPKLLLPKRQSPVGASPQSRAKQSLSVRQSVTSKFPAYSEKSPNVPLIGAQKLISLANSFAVLTPQEPLSSVDVNASEPSTSSLSVQPKTKRNSKKKKAVEPIKGIDELLAEAIQQADAERRKLPPTHWP